MGIARGREKEGKRGGEIGNTTRAHVTTSQLGNLSLLASLLSLSSNPDTPPLTLSPSPFQRVLLKLECTTNIPVCLPSSLLFYFLFSFSFSSFLSLPAVLHQISSLPVLLASQYWILVILDVRPVMRLISWPNQHLSTKIHTMQFHYLFI